MQVQLGWAHFFGPDINTPSPFTSLDAEKETSGKKMLPIL
jgi:hypothetical protein